MEANFRLFQADRFAFLDVLYISLSASMVGPAAVRAWRYGLTFSSLSYLALSFLGAAIPLCGVVFWGDHYRQHRQSFLIFFRIIKLITVGLFGFRQQTTDLTLTIMTYSILNGMQAIGTQLVLPMHLSFQLLSVMIIGLKSVFLCNLDDSVDSIEGCKLVTSSLILFVVTLLVPSFIAYRVEKQQRCVYSHGSSTTQKQA